MVSEIRTELSSNQGGKNKLRTNTRGQNVQKENDVKPEKIKTRIR